MRTLDTWYKELTHLKRPWCWEWLRAGWKGDNRGWDGWMASTQWTWVGDGQGSLACCGLWGHKESDTTEWLNWTESRLKTCCTNIRLWSHLDLDNLLSFCISACYFILHFDVLEIASFLKRHEPTSASFKLLLSFLTSLNLHKIEENFPILLLRLWLKEMV